MKLHYQTVSPVLMDCLHKLMNHPAFRDFYLVGGTSLSLQRGHRLSIDIDLDTMGCMQSDAQFKTNKKSLPKLESSFFIYLITIIFPS